MKKEEVEKIKKIIENRTSKYNYTPSELAQAIASQITIDVEEVGKIINKTMKYYGESCPKDYKIVLIEVALKKANPIKIEEVEK